MCGIAGIIGERNQVAAHKLLRKIKHRGPDADGIWLSHVDESPATLCHSRLSIIDLTDLGAQPFHSADNKYVIVFNGEIYNFVELRNDLVVKYNCVFRSESDTEVLLQGLIHEGLEFVKKCNGMWAFCLWDRLEGKAILCRDRFGVKPLYYASLSNGRTGFSSEMKGLSPLLDSLAPSFDLDSFFLNQFDYEFSDLCVINGITRVPPGSYVVVAAGNVDVRKWWNALDNIIPENSNYDSQVVKWRELFVDSVRLRMRSDVPVGTALSGGLDSSSVVATMASIGTAKHQLQPRLAVDWQYAVCCTFPNSSLDETHWAQLVADSCGVSLTSVPIDPTACSWNLVDALAQVEDPYLTIPLPMLATYRAIKLSGISVTLDGHGADEMFSGYGHLRSALSCAKSGREYQEILAIDESTKTGVYSLNEKNRVKACLRARIKTLLARRGILPRALANKILPLRLKNRGHVDAFTSRLFAARMEMRSHDAYQSMDPFSQVLYEIFNVTILPTLLRNYDRYSMASGLEVRMPFMDWRLVCYTFSLPWQSKVGASFTKRIMRDSLAGILCDPVRLRRDKIGWNAPAHEYFKGPLRPFIEDSLASGDDSACLRQARIAWKAFDSIQAPTFADGQALWNAVLPHFWIKSLASPAWN